MRKKEHEQETGGAEGDVGGEGNSDDGGDGALWAVTPKLRVDPSWIKVSKCFTTFTRGVSSHSPTEILVL